MKLVSIEKLHRSIHVKKSVPWDYAWKSLFRILELVVKQGRNSIYLIWQPIITSVEVEEKRVVRVASLKERLHIACIIKTLITGFSQLVYCSVEQVNKTKLQICNLKNVE